MRPNNVSTSCGFRPATPSPIVRSAFRRGRAPALAAHPAGRLGARRCPDRADGAPGATRRHSRARSWRARHAPQSLRSRQRSDLRQQRQPDPALAAVGAPVTAPQPPETTRSRRRCGRVSALTCANTRNPQPRRRPFVSPETRGKGPPRRLSDRSEREVSRDKRDTPVRHPQRPLPQRSTRTDASDRTEPVAGAGTIPDHSGTPERRRSEREPRDCCRDGPAGQAGPGAAAVSRRAPVHAERCVPLPAENGPTDQDGPARRTTQ